MLGTRWPAATGAPYNSLRLVSTHSSFGYFGERDGKRTRSGLRVRKEAMKKLQLDRALQLPDCRQYRSWRARNAAGPVRGLAMLLQLAEVLATESCDSHAARPVQLRVQNISGG